MAQTEQSTDAGKPEDKSKSPETPPKEDPKPPKDPKPQKGSKASEDTGLDWSRLAMKALAIFRIAKDGVLSMKDYGDHVVIVTKGGSKVSYSEGSKDKDIEPLSRTAVTGEVPEHVARERAAREQR